MATIRDVARLAGVSTATVSHVINDTRVVLPETRQLVLDAISQLNYRPSSLARSLTTNTTRSIGVVIADVTSPFFAQLLYKIEDMLLAGNYDLFLSHTYEETEREARTLENLINRRVDGVILTPTGLPQTAFATFEQLNIPTVFIDRQPPNARGSFVGTDNNSAAHEAASHLIELGHRRIGLVTLLPETSAVTARLHGYRRALAEHNIPFDEALVTATRVDAVHACEQVRQLLSQPQPPTAIIAGNHIATMGTLQAFQELELSYPEDVSLICFDNSPWTALIKPALTVVRKPITALAEQAVNILLQEIKQIEQQRRRQEIIELPPTSQLLLDTELIIRESCRPIQP
jgi:LacI family transcriptional regulator